MVKKVPHNDSEAFSCEECSLRYSDQAMAERCEAWCREHKSCNLGIIQHAIPDSLVSDRKQE